MKQVFFILKIKRLRSLVLLEMQCFLIFVKTFKNISCPNLVVGCQNGNLAKTIRTATSLHVLFEILKEDSFYGTLGKVVVVSIYFLQIVKT